MNRLLKDIPSKPFQLSNSGLNSLEWYLLIFGLALMSFLLSWPIFNFGIAIEVALAIFTGMVLLRIFLRHSRRGRWHLIVGELVTPGFLWLLFGFGGIISLLKLDDIHYYGIKYDIATVIMFSLYALIGGICYIIAFRVIFKNSPFAESRAKSKISKRKVLILLLIVLSIDWYSRYKLISAGLYFNWAVMAATKLGLLDKTIRGISMLFHIQRAIGPIALSLLTYLALSSRRGWPYSLLILLQILLIAVNGDRSDLLFSFFILAVSYAMVKRIRIDVKLLFVGALFALIFFGIISPLIQEARIFMRRDARQLIRDPASIPARFVFDYLPKSLDPEAIFDRDDTSNRQSLLGRVGGYMTYAASMYESIMNGRRLQPLSGARDELSLLIPRVLYPQKPSVDADARLQRHFRIGMPGYDSPGTHLVDVFSFFHIAGVVLLFLFMGMLYGFMANHLSFRYGLLGNIILIGMMPLFVPTGDAFAQVFVNVRNIALFLVVVAVVFHGIHILPKPSHRVLRYG